MAIHFYVDLDCEPRRSLGADQLLAKLRELWMAEGVLHKYRQQHGPTPASEVRFKRRVTTPEGEESEREMSAQELLDGTRVIEPFEQYCEGCPAAVTDTPFSCIQRLSLPVSEQSERWLAGTVGPPASLAGQLFRQSAGHMDYGTCETLDQWRAAGFLESKEPFPVGDPADGLDTNALLHAMLMVGDLAPAHALAVLLFTRSLATTEGGGIDEVIKAIQYVQLTQSTDDMPGLVFTPVPESGDDHSTLEFKLFLMAAYRAFSLQSHLVVVM